MRYKTLKLNGPLHPVKLKFVSQRTINRAVASKNESVRGCYIPDENLIYVCREISEEEQLIVVAHELMHAAEFQVSGQEEEARVDTMGRFLLNFARVSKLGGLPWIK